VDIHGKSVLILGGYGLVGQAVARRLLRESPRRLTLLSLKREEAEEAARALKPEQGRSRSFPPGRPLHPGDLKDLPRAQVFGDPARRTRLIDSLIEPLSEAAPPSTSCTSSSPGPGPISSWTR